MFRAVTLYQFAMQGMREKYNKAMALKDDLQKSIKRNKVGVDQSVLHVFQFLAYRNWKRRLVKIKRRFKLLKNSIPKQKPNYKKL